LITMGCGEECPLVHGVQRQDWALQDPKGLPLDAVRRVRDDIRAKAAQAGSAHGWQAGTTR
jgi:arsenate reductase